LIQTDWHKDPAKIQMLREEMSQIEKLWNRANRRAAVETTRFDAALDSSVSAMLEVARELERFDGGKATAALDDRQLKARLLDPLAAAGTLQAQRNRRELTRKSAAALAALGKSHAALGRWATAPMKDFAALINRQRGIMGLNPLRLEEKLSAAARGHSEDMARLGFFAHDSPVPDKTTPWDRARLAGFNGHGTGENIFMGASGFEAAYQAWFASDGHRFIMFGSGCNVLGVGLAGVHWTMMTGQSSLAELPVP